MLLFACTAAVLVPATASAQQTLNFSLGVFTPRGEDARVDGDVLNANRTFLFFDIKDFKSASIGGEWLVPFNEFFEGGAGIGFSRRTVPTVYTDFVDIDGSEIEQELRLRMVPIIVHGPRAAARAIQSVPAVLRRRPERGELAVLASPATSSTSTTTGRSSATRLSPAAPPPGRWCSAASGSAGRR